MHFTVSRKGNEVDLPLVARLKAHCRSGRHIKPESKGSLTIEFECGIHLEKMKMAAHLNRTIPSIGHTNCPCCQPLGQDQLPLPNYNFSGNHHSGQTLANRVVNGYQLGAIREGRLHLHLVYYFSNPLHDIITRQNSCPVGHQLRY